MEARHEPAEVKKTGPEIVGIGAGPNGLIFAIHLAEQLKTEIVFIEKHPDYLRDQTVRIDLKDIESPLILNSLKGADTDLTIPIQELEKRLLEIATKELGVKVIYKQFLTPQQYQQELIKHKVENQKDLERELKQEVIVGMGQLSEQFRNCKLMIGADGSNSSVRGLISDEKHLTPNKIDIGKLVALKYEVRGKVDPMNPLKFVLTQPLLDGLLCSERIDYHAETNRTTVTLNFIVDDKIYKDAKLEGVKAKNLLPLSADIPKKLRKAINLWVKTREDQAIVAGSPVLNKTEFSVTLSSQFNKEISHIPVLLLGDALCSFPLMQGLKMGIKNDVRLVKTLAKLWNKIQIGDEAALHQLFEEHAKNTREVYEEGLRRVNKANDKIKKDKKIVNAMYVSSYLPVKAIQHFRANLHPIFFAQEVLPTDELELYIQHCKNEGKRKIAANLFNALKDPRIDFDTMKAALYQAYLRNEELENSKYKSTFKSNIRVNFLSMFSSLAPKKVAASQNLLVPEKMTNDKFSHGLHSIIYKMFLHVSEFQEYYIKKFPKDVSDLKEERRAVVA